MNKPKTRIENIVVQDFANEILIYDLSTNKAFCLNETSAMIYQLCNGKKSVEEISRILTNKLNQPITEDLIWLALDGFKKDNLLEQSEQFAINFNGLSRRQIIKKIGFASLVTLPVIASVIAPQAVQAASCVGLGQPCTNVAFTIGDCCFGQGYCSGDPRRCIPCNPPGSFRGCTFNESICLGNANECCSGSTTATFGCNAGGFSCFCN